MRKIHQIHNSVNTPKRGHFVEYPVRPMKLVLKDFSAEPCSVLIGATLFAGAKLAHKKRGSNRLASTVRYPPVSLTAIEAAQIMVRAFSGIKLSLSCFPLNPKTPSQNIPE